MFMSFNPPINLRFDTSRASRLEKLSYQWLKPILILSGFFGAGAVFTSRYSDNAFVFGILLSAMFAVFLLAYPAGIFAYRHAHSLDDKRSTPRR
jgi:hypothetical protein